MAMQRQTVGRNVIFLTIGPTLFGIVGIFVTGYVARTIGTVEYGKLVFALAFINFFTLFTNLGFNNYIMKEFSRRSKNLEAIYGTVLLTRLGLAVLTSGLAVVTINLLNYPPETKEIVYAAALIILPIYISDSFEGVFKGYEKMQYITGLNILNGILLNLFRFLVVFWGFKALGLAWTRVVCALFVMGIGFYWVHRFFLKAKVTRQWDLYKQVITGTLPFAFSTSFLIIYTRIDILMLSYMQGDAPVAWYKAAGVLTERLSIITTAIIGAIYPAVSRLFVDDRKRAVDLYGRTFFYLFLLSLPLALGGFVLSEPIVLFIFDEKYLNAVPVLQILCSTIPLLFATSIMGNILMATNQEKIFAYVMTLLCITNIIANLVLIPHYAHVGAAMATFFSQAINFLVLLYITNRRFATISVTGKYVKVIFSALIMSAFILYVIHWNVLVLILTGMMIYFLSLYLLRTISKGEMLEIKRMIFRNRGMKIAE